MLALEELLRENVSACHPPNKEKSPIQKIRLNKTASKMPMATLRNIGATQSNIIAIQKHVDPLDNLSNRQIDKNKATADRVDHGVVGIVLMRSHIGNVGYYNADCFVIVGQG